MGGLIDALGVDIWALLWQLFAFLLLMFVLWRFAFGPVTRVLDERASRIRSSVETAERVQREMTDMEQRSRQMLEQSRRDGQQIVQQAQTAAKRLQEEGRSQARAQFEEERTRVLADIERSKQEAMLDLRRQVADLAISAASRVVRRELDPQAHVSLINETLAETGGQQGAGTRPVA